jgi:plasmid stabilization system protein ParE
VIVVFLASAKRDLAWFADYYDSVFPQGRRSAALRYLKAKSAIRSNPHIGHPIEVEGLREFRIARTPFAFIYRVTSREIEIVRVWDQRAKRPRSWV